MFLPLVKMSTEKAIRFLEEIDEDRFIYTLHRLVAHTLQEVWLLKIMTDDYNKVYKIESKDLMKDLIRYGQLPPKAKYNKEYLERKSKGLYPPYTANLPPHILTGNLKSNIRIDYTLDNVTMELIPSAGIKTYGKGKNIKSFNYFLKHEQNKSVLKSTFVLGWQEIINKLSQFLIHEARRFS